jgi:hypothetical protein
VLKNVASIECFLIRVSGDELPSEIAIADATAAAATANENQTAGDSDGDDVKRYTKEELLRIRSLPLCLRKPECLNKPGYKYDCSYVSLKR